MLKISCVVADKFNHSKSIYDITKTIREQKIQRSKKKCKINMNFVRIKHNLPLISHSLFVTTLVRQLKHEKLFNKIKSKVF